VLPYEDFINDTPLETIPYPYIVRDAQCDQPLSRLVTTVELLVTAKHLLQCCRRKDVRYSDMICFLKLNMIGLPNAPYLESYQVRDVATVSRIGDNAESKVCVSEVMLECVDCSMRSSWPLV